MSARAHESGAGGGVVVVLLVFALWAAGSHQPAKPQQSRPRATATTAPASARAPAALSFTDGGGCRPAGDYVSPQLDRRVRQLLTATAAHHRIRVSCLRTGHSWFVAGTTRVSNHSVWRAVDVDQVDVDQVDGRLVSPSNTAARQLVRWIGQGGAGVQPSEVGSPWDFGPLPWFTDAAHQDHIYACHLGEEVIDVLSHGQGVFGIGIGRVWSDTEGDIADLPD